MERQARRRMKEGSLTDEQVERLAETFLQIREKLDELLAAFGLERDDLRLGLRSLGAQSVSQMKPFLEREETTLVDVLDKLLEKGVVVFGDVGISVAEVELINVQLRLIVNAIKKRE
jgi:hypothetical protein